MLQAMAAFTGNAAYGANQAVFAQAVATRAPAQLACAAIPVQIVPKGRRGSARTTATHPASGFHPVYDEANNNAAPTPGHFGWANLDGSTSAQRFENAITRDGGL